MGSGALSSRDSDSAIHLTDRGGRPQVYPAEGAARPRCRFDSYRRRAAGGACSELLGYGTLPMPTTPLMLAALTPTVSQFWSVVVGLNVSRASDCSPTANAGSLLVTM